MKEPFRVQFQSRALATLQSLYRAIVAYPDPRQLPNIEFALTIADTTEDHFGEYANRPIWAFTRKAEQTDIWLMPGNASYPSVKHLTYKHCLTT